MFGGVYVEFCKPPGHSASVFSSEDSDVHLKEISGTSEVVLQSPPIEILKLLNVGTFPTTCK